MKINELVERAAGLWGIDSSWWSVVVDWVTTTVRPPVAVGETVGMSGWGEADGSPPQPVLEGFGVLPEKALGGRASQNWLVRRGEQNLVLRAHRPAPWQSSVELGLAIPWRSLARSRVREHGWPAARPIGRPRWWGESCWTLEEFLAGSVTALTPSRHAGLLARFHALGDDVAVGPQPGRLPHLAVLDDPTADDAIAACRDAVDRGWLMRRLDRARGLAAGIDWSEAATTRGEGVRRHCRAGAR